MELEKRYPPEFLQKLKQVKGKRAQTVIDLILKNGKVTTEDLEEAGYQHAPRAVRDVRELGIPIITKRTKGKNGKNIAVYTFGNPNEVQDIISKKSGRTVQLDKIRHALVEKYGSRCAIYLEDMPEKELQVDHRIPFEIGGEQDLSNLDAFMLLSPSANRKKSWACEHCLNWTKHDIKMCQTCFWAYPDAYDHIAGEKERVVVTHLRGEEAEKYDDFVKKYGREKADELIKESFTKYKI